MLRILALVPLLAAGVDLTRAQLLCGADAQTCLEAAGRGWLGPAAVGLVVAYALAAGLWLARRRVPAHAPFARTWGLAAVTLFGVVNLQELTTRLAGGDGLGGAPLGTLALCVAAGALLALALRALQQTAQLAARAPRALPRPVARMVSSPPPPDPVYVTVDGPCRGRAPPSL